MVTVIVAVPTLSRRRRKPRHAILIIWVTAMSLRLPRRLEQLHFVQCRVDAVPAEQLVVPSNLHDPPPLEHDDRIGSHDRRQPVRDDKRRAVQHQRRQRVLHQQLSFGVERRRRFIQDQHRRVLEQRARDGHPLALSTRQFLPALADSRVVAIGQLRDELVGVRGPGRRFDLSGEARSDP